MPNDINKAIEPQPPDKVEKIVESSKDDFQKASATLGGKDIVGAGAPYASTIKDNAEVANKSINSLASRYQKEYDAYQTKVKTIKDAQTTLGFLNKSLEAANLDLYASVTTAPAPASPETGFGVTRLLDVLPNFNDPTTALKIKNIESRITTVGDQIYDQNQIIKSNSSTTISDDKANLLDLYSQISSATKSMSDYKTTLNEGLSSGNIALAPTEPGPSLFEKEKAKDASYIPTKMSDVASMDPSLLTTLRDSLYQQVQIDPNATDFSENKAEALKQLKELRPPTPAITTVKNPNGTSVIEKDGIPYAVTVKDTDGKTLTFTAFNSNMLTVPATPPNTPSSIPTTPQKIVEIPKSQNKKDAQQQTNNASTVVAPGTDLGTNQGQTTPPADTSTPQGQGTGNGAGGTCNDCGCVKCCCPGK